MTLTQYFMRNTKIVIFKCLLDQPKTFKNNNVAAENRKELHKPE